MIKKSVRYLSIAAGVMALAPSMASAFHGNVIQCVPSAGRTNVTNFKPGLTCYNQLNVLTVVATGGSSFDQCHANTITHPVMANPAPWDAWNAGKWTKVTSAQADSIATADIKLKGSTFGGMNFAPVSAADSAAGASGGGTITFRDGSGKSVAKSDFFGSVQGNKGPPPTAQTLGVVTKGLGLGAQILIGIDLAASDASSGNIIGANVGSACTGPTDDLWVTGGAKGCTAAGAPSACCTAKKTGATCVTPNTTLGLTTGSAAVLSIDIVSNKDCTGLHTPYYCCTAALTGTCGAS